MGQNFSKPAVQGTYWDDSHNGLSDEERDGRQSRGTTSGPKYISHVDNYLMQIYRDVMFKLARCHDKSIYDNEQEAALCKEITLGIYEICKIMGDLQGLYHLENPLRKKTSLNVYEVCKVMGDLICMKLPKSRNTSQEVERAMSIALFFRRDVMMAISVDADDQGEAIQGDAPQADALQGDAGQGDAHQGDAPELLTTSAQGHDCEPLSDKFQFL